ncbi:MAG: SpoIIE family protein phosphatase [Spirochaetia bacterium]|nr:SpoIIE family protein phosphatase [Spirochaetia bacterium]
MHVLQKSDPSLDRRKSERPIFSAFELGKICIIDQNLARITSGRIENIHEETVVTEIHDLYKSYTDLDFIPVMSGSKISGYLRKQMFFAQLSETRFSRELLLRSDVTASSMMDPRVTVLDSRMNLSEASELLMNREESVRFDPFVITHESRLLGTSTVQRVLEGLNHFLKMDFQSCDLTQKKLMTPMNRGVELTLNHHQILQPLLAPGGDYVDVIELNERYSLALLFDVCGKGLKASTMVNSLASILKTLVYKLDQEGIDLPGILLMMHSLNQLLFHLTCEEMYATGVALIIDKQKSVLTVLDYGHGFLWLKRNRSIHRLCAHIQNSIAVPFLGIHENLEIQAGHFRIHPGDLLFACSDGLTEARNSARQEYGADRIKTMLRFGPSTNAITTNEAILRDLEAFRGGARRTDDLSVLAIQF